MKNLTLIDTGFLGATSGNFSPLSLSPSLWLDASDASTITSSAGKVSQWNDKSGNGRNVVQATGTRQPTINATTQNNLNVLDFDGGDQMLSGTAQFVNATNGVYTVFAVAKPNNLVGTKQIICSDTSGNPRRAQFLRFSNDAPMTIAHNTANTAFSDTAASIATATFVYVTATATTTTLETRLNGATNGTTGYTGTLQNTTGRVAIGSQVGIFEYLNGSVGEVLLYPTTLSVTDRASVESYLAAKWAL